MMTELRPKAGDGENPLVVAERVRDYPLVADIGRVITDDTRLVLVDPALRDSVAKRLPVDFHSLVRGSVQLWSTKIDALGVSRIPGRQDLYWWPHVYDPTFLGYMTGVLNIQKFIDQGGAIL
jgi:hypothetical protein